jgi:nicotinamide mononucleotide transporter PnuC
MDSLSQWGGTIVEWTAAGFGLSGVVLGLRQRPSTWVCWSGSSVLYLGLMWNAALYGQAALMGVFAATSMWGYVRWRSASPTQPSASGVQSLPTRSAFLLGAGVLVLCGLWGRFMHDAGGQSQWLDGVVAVLSLLAMGLMARRYLICWPIWGLVNSLSIILFARQALWATTALYAVQLVLSGIGYRTWLRASPSAKLLTGIPVDAR